MGLFNQLRTAFVEPYKTYLDREPTPEPEPKPTIPRVTSLEEEIGRGITTGIGNLLKAVAQGTARSGASVGLTASYPITKRYELTDEDLSPTMLRFKEMVFGKGPLKSIQTRIAEAELKTEAVGKKYGVSFVEKGALPLSVIGVVGMIGLDFTTGGGKDDVIKTLARTDTISDIIRILKKVNVADDLIPTYSKIIAGLNKTDDVAKVLDKISDIQKTTKLGGEVAEQAPKARKFLDSVQNARPDIPLRTGGQYIPRSTDELAVKARTLIVENINKAEELARTGTDDMAVATASELIKHYGDEAAKATSKASQNALYDQASDLAHLTAKNLTEQGQAIQAASIMGRQTPEGILRFSAREINRYNETARAGNKIPQLTAVQSKKILETAKKIEDMPDGIKKAMAFHELSNTIAELVPTSLYKKLISVWKAGLLTGAKTSGLNTFSNLFHGTSEVIKDIPAVAIDSIASLFTKQRTLGLTTKQSGKGVLEGLKKGWRYLATGFDERNVGAKLDYQKVFFGKSKLAKAIQKYEESVFHLMGAEDQPFFYGAKARSLYSQAIAKAKNLKLKGTEATKYIDDLVKNPTDDMLRYAVGDAEIAVFQNQTTLGKIAKAFQNAPGGEIIVPFGRTPSAVANQLINYSPIGIVKTIGQNIRKGTFDQRLFSQGIGRGMTGSAVLYLGTELYKKGMITLNYPTTEKERELWRLEGRKANTIKIGDSWRNINALGPAGMVLIAGGQYQRTLEETGSVIQSLVAATVGSAKSLTEQTFLRGVSQALEALANPERSFEGWFSNTIASVIPTLVNDVAKAIDPKERKSLGVLGRLKSRVPFIRETLEPQVDVLGQQRLKAGNWLETMADPTRPSEILSSPVIDELRRLFDKGYKVTPTKLGDKDGYDGLTPQQNTQLLMKAGELTNSKLSNLIALEEYKKLSDEGKSELVKGIADTAKLMARALTVMEMTEGLEGDELRNTLSQMKADGLMTEAVLRAYLELR